MESKSFFPGLPEERDVPEIFDKSEETEIPTTSNTFRKGHNAEKIKFFPGVDYVHMKNDGTILTDEQPCTHSSENGCVETKEDNDSKTISEKTDESIFKAHSADEQRVNFHRARKRASTNQTFLDRRLSGIFRRAHSLKARWLRGPRKSKLGSMTDAELFKWPVLERKIRQDSFGDTDTDMFPKTVYGQSYLKEIHEKKRTYPEQEEDVQWDFSGDKPKPYHKFTYELAAALQLDANVKAALKREGPISRPKSVCEQSDANEIQAKKQNMVVECEQMHNEQAGTGSEDEYVECDNSYNNDKELRSKSKERVSEEKSERVDEIPAEAHDSSLSQKAIGGSEEIHDKADKRAVLREYRVKQLRKLLQSDVTDEQIEDIVEAEFLAKDAAAYAKELSIKAASSLAFAKKADEEAKRVREIADRCDIEACKAQADASDASAKAALAADKLVEIHGAYATDFRFIQEIGEVVDLADASGNGEFAFWSSSSATPSRPKSLIVRLCHRCFARMDVGHRAIFVWTLLLFELIFLVVYLDGGLDRETLIFFSILWFFDLLSLTEVVAGIVRYYKIRSECSDGNHLQSTFDLQKTVVVTVLLLLKTVFELLLYGHLRFGYLSLVWVMLPLWLFFTIVIAQLFVHIVKIHQKAVSEESR
uniref:Protein kinase domain-containing protein n=1 Tax=Syphacia muris TaxID=451379 RepID=A0A158R3Y5_9BILA